MPQCVLLLLLSSSSSSRIRLIVVSKQAAARCSNTDLKMCNFCSQFGGMLPGDDDEFDLDDFLDMCEQNADWGQLDGSKSNANDEMMSDDGDADEEERRLRLQVLGVPSSDLGGNRNIGKRRHRLRVMEWAQHHLEVAGYGTGRLVSISCLDGKTTILLLDTQNGLEVSIFKSIADVTEDDVQRGIAAADAGAKSEKAASLKGKVDPPSSPSPDDVSSVPVDGDSSNKRQRTNDIKSPSATSAFSQYFDQIENRIKKDITEDPKV